jgi:hypothetical protein
MMEELYTTPPPNVCITVVTFQDFIKFWGNFFCFVFVLLVLIENPQGFKNFLSLFKGFI